jgi:DNA polymerase
MRKIVDAEGLESTRRGYESITTQADFSPASRQLQLWGGTLTENVTQRMARDVIAEAVVRLEATGFPVIFNSHDELILEVDIAGKEEARKEIDRLMLRAPAWAPDLPLGTEGEFAETYLK